MEAEQMKALIEKARDHKMTPAERFEQRVSFVYSGVSSTTTREDVRARLAEEYGDPMAYEARISDLEAQLTARDAEIAEMKRNVARHCTNHAPCYKMRGAP